MPGTVLGGRYRLEAIIGSGALGVVWRARHLVLESECALKLFEPAPGLDPQRSGAQFLRAARVTARLSSPHVAQVFDYGLHGSLPFVAMELLQGISLARCLDARSSEGRRLSPVATLQVAQHVARGLAAAHSARIVHGNLSTTNIHLVPEGSSFVAKVLDFGVARWSTGTAPGSTTAYTLAGAAHYACPEQLEGASDIDHRADLWSLAVIAFECLTGQVPFPGESYIDVAFRVCKQGPPRASQLAAVPAGFDAWFARAAARERERRFSSALEQVDALAMLCAGVGEPLLLQGPSRQPPESPAESWVPAAAPPPPPTPMARAAPLRPTAMAPRPGAGWVALPALICAAATWALLSLHARSSERSMPARPSQLAPGSSAAGSSAAGSSAGWRSSAPGLPSADAGSEPHAPPPAIAPVRSPGPGAGPDCRQPYWLDAQGRRRLELDCL